MTSAAAEEARGGPLPDLIWQAPVFTCEERRLDVTKNPDDVDCSPLILLFIVVYDLILFEY